MSNRTNRPPPLELVSKPLPAPPRPPSSLYSCDEDADDTDMSYTYVNGLVSPTKSSAISSPISITNPQATVSFLYSQSEHSTLVSTPQKHMILYHELSGDDDESVAELPWNKFTQEVLSKNPKPNPFGPHPTRAKRSTEGHNSTLNSPAKSDFYGRASIDSDTVSISEILIDNMLNI